MKIGDYDMKIKAGKYYKTKVCGEMAILKVNAIEKKFIASSPHYMENLFTMGFNVYTSSCNILYLESGRYAELEIVSEWSLGDELEEIPNELFDKAVRLHHTSMAAINALFNNEKPS